MCRNNVCIVPLVIAVILGIIIGALFFFGIILVTIIATPIIIALIFAVITLILLFVTAAFGMKKETKECICDFGRCIALGGLATFVTGFLALTFIGFLSAGSIVSALLIGIFGFGLILNFLSFAGLLVCLVISNCRRMNVYCKFENDYNE